ncbi:MAG: hypothetical protein HN909_00815 [Phycisphaerales bacterium]|mgnify:CR=1|jgi:hypothetical protein|nr:hypothetical protein [Phycisphaerales bacterium]MBT7170291.1 hypothetical protein [Phycisphaerales bacterium]
MDNRYRLCPQCGSTVFQTAALGDRIDFQVRLTGQGAPLDGGADFPPPATIYCRDCAWRGSGDELDILL